MHKCQCRKRAKDYYKFIITISGYTTGCKRCKTFESFVYYTVIRFFHIVKTCISTCMREHRICEKKDKKKFELVLIYYILLYSITTQTRARIIADLANEYKSVNCYEKMRLRSLEIY